MRCTINKRDSIMSNTTTVSLSEARQNLSQLVSNVSKQESAPVSITVRGHNVAVLLSQTDYDELLKAKYKAEFQSVFDELDDFNKAMLNK